MSLDRVATSELDSHVALELYRTVYRIRRFEETVAELFKAGELPGFVHSYIGTEGVAAGVCAHLHRSDVVTSTHRGHGHCIAKGVELAPMMAELYGRSTGSCRGKAGSMHIVDVANGVLGCNGIVGGGMPMAVGAALAMTMQHRNGVAVCFLGDGAVNQGVFHESLNLAGIWHLPVVFVIENNQYTEFFHYTEVTAIANLAERGAAYGMPGIVVDGQDALAVFESSAEPIARARNGGGPTLVEAKTYRFHGHYEGEDALLGRDAYRTMDELDYYIGSRDPLDLLRTHLTTRGTPSDLRERIEQEVEQELSLAIEFGRTGLDPSPDQLLVDVLAAY